MTKKEAADTDTVKARIGDVYEDTQGMLIEGAPTGKGVLWTVVGLGCDGMLVGRAKHSPTTANVQMRLILRGERFKRVSKGTGDVLHAVPDFTDKNVSLPFNCLHGKAAQAGNDEPKPACVECATYKRMGEEQRAKTDDAYKVVARALWTSFYGTGRA